MILANGQRAGFFIGDGAGVGKGRQVNMACCIENFSIVLCFIAQKYKKIQNSI